MVNKMADGSKRTFKQKLEIINLVEKAPQANKKKDIAAELSVPSSTFSTILKNKATLKESHSFGCTSKKRQRDPSQADVDMALFQWSIAARAQSVPISGKVMKGEGQRTGCGAGPCSILDLLIWMAVTMEEKMQHQL